MLYYIKVFSHSRTSCTDSRLSFSSLTMDSSQSPFRPECLREKVALITGGGSGIGYEISRQIGLHGGKVVIMGRREKFLSKAVHQLQADGVTASYFAGDVRSRESAEAAVEFTVKTYGRMDALVNGAAGNFLANAHELKLKGFKTVMEIDTIGVFNMSTAAFPALRESGGGAIINISMTLHYGATWFQAHASAAKAAIDSLTRSLALEWGSHGIRVNGIAPGPIANTPGMMKLAPGLGKPTEFAQKVPLGRLGTTFDIGIAAVFLLSSAASYVSGDTLVVDGADWLHKDPLIPPEQVTRMSRAVEQRSRTMGPTSRL